MQITGKIIFISQIAQGVSKAGKEWRKIEFVVEETEGKYPNSVCLSAMGPKIEEVLGWNVGDEGTFYFNVNARKYNERYYTSLNYFKAEIRPQNAPQGYFPQQAAPAPQPLPQNLFDKDPKDDDLPF